MKISLKALIRILKDVEGDGALLIEKGQRPNIIYIKCYYPNKVNKLIYDLEKDKVTKVDTEWAVFLEETIHNIMESQNKRENNDSDGIKDWSEHDNFAKSMSTPTNHIKANRI